MVHLEDVNAGREWLEFIGALDRFMKTALMMMMMYTVIKHCTLCANNHYDYVLESDCCFKAASGCRGRHACICNFKSCSGDILKVSYDPWRKPWPIYEVLRQLDYVYTIQS